MTTVICTLILMSSPNSRDVVRVKGKLINDINETWVVDFTSFIKTNPKYMEYNNLVIHINNNYCEYVK